MISMASITLLLILSAMATLFSLLNLKRWKEIDIDRARATVFLDKSFLCTNFKLTLAAVGLVFLHFIIMEYYEIHQLEVTGLFSFIYYGVFILSMLALVMLVMIWYRLLHKK